MNRAVGTPPAGSTSAATPVSAGRARVAGWVLFVASAALYLLYSWTRHARFGSGSWDLGCYAQSAWLAGRFGAMTSTLLRGAHVLGDHFLPIVYLLGPILHVWRDAAALLAIQASAIASIAFPLLWLSRRAGLGLAPGIAVALAFLLALGTQSAVEFDFHHVALGAAFFAYAYWYLETGKAGRAVLFAALLVATREDAWLHAAALGFHAMLFQGRRRLGAALAVVGVAGFVAVVQWIMPAFAGAASGVAHLQRFEQFGDAPWPALVRAVGDPLRTLSIALTPWQKVESLLLVVAGFAGLPFLSPRHLVLALPILAERFLSTKPELWGTGFHYGLMTTLVAALAAVSGAARAQRLLAGTWQRFTGADSPERTAGRALAGVLVLAAVLVDVRGERAEFAHLTKPYFARDVTANRRALGVVPRDASVAAQDHFVPHLALREHVYLLEDAHRAEWVVANPADGTWPYRREEVVAALRGLMADGYRPVFSEGTALVLRRGAAEPVPLSRDLAQALVAIRRRASRRRAPGTPATRGMARPPP
jgi:uncharacterized membrane protein